MREEWMDAVREGGSKGGKDRRIDSMRVEGAS